MHYQNAIVTRSSLNSLRNNIWRGWRRLPRCGSSWGGCGPPRAPRVGGWHLQGKISAAGAERSQMCCRGSKTASGSPRPLLPRLSPLSLLNCLRGCRVLQFSGKQGWGPWGGSDLGRGGTTGTVGNWARSGWPQPSSPRQHELVSAGKHHTGPGRAAHPGLGSRPSVVPGTNPGEILCPPGYTLPGRMLSSPWGGLGGSQRAAPQQ